VTLLSLEAALALDRHPIRAHPPPLAPRLDLARELDRPAEQQQFLAGAGCEMIAKVPRRAISSVLINRLQFVPGFGPSLASGPAAPAPAVDMMTARLFANSCRPNEGSVHTVRA
jgi:hypothetical protein